MINNNDGVLEWGCFYQNLFACDFTSSALPWLQQLQRNPGEVLQIPPKLCLYWPQRLQSEQWFSSTLWQHEEVYGEKNCYKCYTWGTYCASSKKYLAGQVPLSLSTIMKHTEGCDEPNEGEEDKISQHTILILKHADFVSEWWKLCFRRLEFSKFLGGWCPQTPLSSNPLC